VAILVIGAASAACGSEGGSGSATSGRPTIVVTTSVWGDIVGEAIGDIADVEVIVPVGADPHDFAPSARQADTMAGADLLVVNGLGLEAGMTDVIDRVAESGTPVFVIADSVPALDADPHLWMDPTRAATALAALGTRIGDVPGIDRPSLDAAIAAQVGALGALDGELEATLATVPPERRVLITSHDSFGYFADRYGFEVVGSLIPSNTTGASPSAAGLERLATAIRERDLPAIFTESTRSGQLAEALAAEVGRPVEIVELFTDSLGSPGSGADSYQGFLTVDAQRIAAALT